MRSTPFLDRSKTPFHRDHKYSSPRNTLFVTAHSSSASLFPGANKQKDTLFRTKTENTSFSSGHTSWKHERNDAEASRAREQSATSEWLSGFRTQRNTPKWGSPERSASPSQWSAKTQVQQASQQQHSFLKKDQTPPPNLFSKNYREESRSPYERKSPSPPRTVSSQPFSSSQRPSQQRTSIQPVKCAQLPLIPKEVSQSYRVKDNEKTQIQEKLAILGEGIDNALNPSSGQYAMEAYLYNKLPPGISKEDRKILTIEPSLAPSLIYDDVAYPVNSAKWNEKKQRNPDPSSLYPALVMGMDELQARQQHQVSAYFGVTQRMTKLASDYQQEKQQSDSYNRKSFKRIEKKLKKLRRVQAAVRGLIEGTLSEPFQNQGVYCDKNIQKLAQEAQNLVLSQASIPDDVITLSTMDKEGRRVAYQKVTQFVFNSLKQKTQEVLKEEEYGSAGTTEAVLEESLHALQSAKQEEEKNRKETIKVVELARRLAQFSA